MRYNDLREDTEGRHILAAKYAATTFGHKNSIEAFQIYESENRKVTIISTNGFEEKDYLTPYEGYEIAVSLNRIFGALTDKLWAQPQISMAVSIRGRTDKASNLSRPRALVGLHMFWSDAFWPDETQEEESLEVMTISGIYHKATSHMFSTTLALRPSHINLLISITNLALVVRTKGRN